MSFFKILYKTLLILLVLPNLVFGQTGLPSPITTESSPNHLKAQQLSLSPDAVTKISTVQKPKVAYSRRKLYGLMTGGFAITLSVLSYVCYRKFTQWQDIPQNQSSIIPDKQPQPSQEADLPLTSSHSLLPASQEADLPLTSSQSPLPASQEADLPLTSSQGASAKDSGSHLENIPLDILGIILTSTGDHRTNMNLAATSKKLRELIVKIYSASPIAYFKLYSQSHNLYKAQNQNCFVPELDTKLLDCAQRSNPLLWFFHYSIPRLFLNGELPLPYIHAFFKELENLKSASPQVFAKLSDDIKSSILPINIVPTMPNPPESNQDHNTAQHHCLQAITTFVTKLPQLDFKLPASKIAISFYNTTNKLTHVQGRMAVTGENRGPYNGLILNALQAFYTQNPQLTYIKIEGKNYYLKDTLYLAGASPAASSTNLQTLHITYNGLFPIIHNSAFQMVGAFQEMAIEVCDPKKIKWHGNVAYLFLENFNPYSTPRNLRLLNYVFPKQAYTPDEEDCPNYYLRKYSVKNFFKAPEFWIRDN
jgi:hypothetical protein